MTLIATLRERRIHYAVIGGIAVIQHARVRTTDDIDVLLAVTQVGMPGLFETLRERGFSVDIERNVCDLKDSGITLVRFGNVVVDLMRPVIPAFAHVLDRAVETDVFGERVRIASAEGLIVLKLSAMRPQDQTDIQDLLSSYGTKLDLAFVRRELATFAPPDDPRHEQLERWVRESAVTG